MNFPRRFQPARVHELRAFFSSARLVLLLALTGLANARGASSLAESFTTSERRELQREGRAIVDLLQNLHYSARHFHQIEASEMIDALLHRLDPTGYVFPADERMRFHHRFDRTFKNVYLLKGDDQPALELFDRFKTRVAQRVKWINARLDAPIDLEADECLPAAGLPLPADDAATDRQWELRLKNVLIEEILAGRDRDAAVAEVRRSFERWSKQIEGVSGTEVREQFWEAVIGLFDPHSGYFAPGNAREFQVMMDGEITGAGLDVWMNEGKCLVSSLLPGGPAEKQGVLRSGDEIVALAEADGPWVPTGGKKLDQVLAMMRGKSGTTVRLAYRSPESDARQEATLVRQDVVLADQRARGGVADLPREGTSPLRVGWIDLPDFYTAGEKGAKSSAARDVRHLVEQMKTKRIGALVIDLRANPGGALTEAVALAGLFISSGPVLVTQGDDGKPAELAVEKSDAIFDGPLVVLTSTASASASEVFAGAMKFHRRAIVVGPEHTYGKGTMQSYVDLNKIGGRSPGGMSWGTLRITRDTFFAPDGQSPQRIGVSSDLVLPTFSATSEDTEAELPHALPPMKLDHLEAKRTTGAFVPITLDLIAQLKAASQQRVDHWPEFALRRRAGELAKREAKTEGLTLRLAQRVEAQTNSDREHAELRRETLQLARTAGYTAEDIDIASVAKAMEDHVAFARAHRPTAKTGWIVGNAFFYEDARGKVRDVELGRFRYRQHARDAEALATVFSRAAGQPIAPEPLAGALKAAALVEQLTDAKLMACFASLAVDAAATRSGVEALLTHFAAGEPTLMYSPGATDISLREALRIGADWAAYLEQSGGTSKIVAADASARTP